MMFIDKLGFKFAAATSFALALSVGALANASTSQSQSRAQAEMGRPLLMLSNAASSQILRTPNSGAPNPPPPANSGAPSNSPGPIIPPDGQTPSK